MVTRGRVRPDTFVDSVALMQVTERVRTLPGVQGAALVMATDLNRRLLDEGGLLPAEAEGAGSADLVIAVRAGSAAAAEAALDRAAELLAARRSDQGPARSAPPRSIVSAARRLPGANVALVSVPGAHATAEAHQALSAGLHVFLFSDGVPLADEILLKRRAQARGLLVMGPECGTSLLNGVGLGFANRVRRGAVGLVAASGTGLQEVASLVHRLGAGVSQGIGTGGRDLDDAVGGLATLQVLSWLARDPETRVIGLVSKAPSPGVAERVLEAARATGKPVVAYLSGWRRATPTGVLGVATLEAAALACVRALGRRTPGFPRPRAGRPGRARPGRVLGLFTGGTLLDEARTIVGDAALEFVDFGDAGYTRGRPHPIIDPSLRSAAVARAGSDRRVGVLLVDVILGDAAHPDPAGPLVGAVGEARGRARRARRTIEVIAHVVGTDQDPQGLAEQEGKLRRAGVRVCPTNRLAAELARDLAGERRGR
jgi:succinyl-CoA synthetase alpha subunit